MWRRQYNNKIYRQQPNGKAPGCQFLHEQDVGRFRLSVCDAPLHSAAHDFRLRKEAVSQQLAEKGFGSRLRAPLDTVSAALHCTDRLHATQSPMLVCRLKRMAFMGTVYTRTIYIEPIDMGILSEDCAQ